LEISIQYSFTFFIFIASEVAVKGQKKIVHGFGGVNVQMTQIYIDYASLPSIRDITLEEVRFFYRPLIDGLIEIQKAKIKADKNNGQ
jgi:hypothetical protein